MDNPKNISLKVGLYSSMALTILTMVTFAFAMIAIPPSGPRSAEAPASAALIFTGCSLMKYLRLRQSLSRTRDIQDLINKGVLQKEAAGGRSTNYELIKNASR